MESDNKFKAFKIPILAFFSRGLYREVAKEWKGVGFSYLFSILFLTSLCSAIRMELTLIFEVMPQFTREIIDPWPTIKVSNGEYHMDRPSPYEIGSPPLAVFDFRKEPPAESLRENCLLFTRSGIKFNNSDGDSTPVPFQVPDGTIMNSRILKQYVLLAQYLFMPVCLLISLPSALILAVIQCLVLAAIGKAVAHFRRTPLNYASLLRLAAVALTPVLIVDLLWQFFIQSGHSMPKLAATTLITIAYFTFALLCIRRGPSAEQPAAE